MKAWGLLALATVVLMAGVAHGADPRRKDSAGRTALQIAKAESHEAVVAVLAKL